MMNDSLLVNASTLFYNASSAYVYDPTMTYEQTIIRFCGSVQSGTIHVFLFLTIAYIVHALYGVLIGFARRRGWWWYGKHYQTYEYVYSVVGEQLSLMYFIVIVTLLLIRLYGGGSW